MLPPHTLQLHCRQPRILGLRTLHPSPECYDLRSHLLCTQWKKYTCTAQNPLPHWQRTQFCCIPLSLGGAKPLGRKFPDLPKPWDGLFPYGSLNKLHAKSPAVRNYKQTAQGTASAISTPRWASSSAPEQPRHCQPSQNLHRTLCTPCSCRKPGPCSQRGTESSEHI